MADATPAATPTEKAPAVKGGGRSKAPARAKGSEPETRSPGDVWYTKNGPAVYRHTQLTETRSTAVRVDGPNGELPPDVKLDAPAEESAE